MSVNVPNKMPVPFANAGLKNTIPPNTDNVNGLAGYSAGFGAINMTPKTAGGIPPFGQDFNGILFAITEGLRFFQAGSIYTYDSTFSTAVGGYRSGARVLRSDGSGYWLNLTDGNTANPEAAGAAAAGWVPDFTYGASSVAMSNANVTLTPDQYGKPFIVINGALTANVSLILPNIFGSWAIIDNTSGAFGITCRTAAGSGVIANKGAVTLIYGDTFNIYGANVNIELTGSVVSFARNTAPNGWLKANGAAVSRVAYAALFSVIGTTFGAGDGSTTFNLPDIRGEAIRGWDDGRGVDAGRAFGSGQLDAFQTHGHVLAVKSGASASDAIAATNYLSSRSGSGLNLANAGPPDIFNTVMVTEPISVGASPAPRTASETRMRNVALLACIKF